MRAQLRGLDPDLPLFEILTVDDLAYVLNWDRRVFGSMFVIFAAMALVMAAVGLYAVTAYSVSQRTREFGVHMALGASASHVQWLVARRATPQVVIGLLLGIAGTVAVTRLIPAILTVSEAGEPRILGGVFAALVAVAASACLGPARRATRIDPVQALRAD
jgi:putative ABC transport system permease protein